jgi:hypothetical protein
LPTPNNSALDNIALRTASASQPLFIQFPLVANKATKPRPYALIFSFNLQNKGIRARLGRLSATKGGVINKGGKDKVYQVWVIGF